MVDALLEILETQENELRFKEVSFSFLHEIGERLLFLAGERGGKVYVQIRVSGDVVYASAMDGTSRNNIAWARRKANTAELAGKSSLRDGLINRAKGRTLSERGLSETDYTEEGGSFPLLLDVFALSIFFFLFLKYPCHFPLLCWPVSAGVSSSVILPESRNT